MRAIAHSVERVEAALAEAEANLLNENATFWDGETDETFPISQYEKVNGYSYQTHIDFLRLSLEFWKSVEKSQCNA